MTGKAIREFVESGYPFSVTTTHGKTYSVPHRDYVSLNPTGRLITIYDDEDGAITLDVALLTGVEHAANVEPA